MNLNTYLIAYLENEVNTLDKQINKNKYGTRVTYYLIGRKSAFKELLEGLKK